MIQPRDPEERYGPALEKAREDLRRLDPYKIVYCSDATYQETTKATGLFELPFWGTPCLIRYPDGDVQDKDTGQELSIVSQILVLHYLIQADGTPMANQWVAFRELPGGLGYNAAFQGRADHRLATTFGHDLESFVRAAEALGGERITYGDAAFLFRIFPRLWMAAILYLADEEFGASASVLLDGAADHYLPTEDLAVLGGLLAGRLIRKAREK
ncbi:MAG: DUF3786 domain-containing protein [Chloroflexota bacterium]|nr:DUF3786 domain-containing protein [Chloroflexota bacterium]